MSTFHLLAAAGFLAGSVVAMASDAASRPASPLKALRDHYRVLILFAAAADDAKLIEQQQNVRRDAGGYAARDLTVFDVIGDAVTRDEQPMPPGTAAALRQAVDGKDFSVVLVGKDGDVKLREDHAVPNERLFALIDAMPMRQQEKHERGG